MAQFHAALVNVLGVGVLLRGDSAVGKSECALELVQRGHRLVADDEQHGFGNGGGQGQGSGSQKCSTPAH